MGDGETVIVLNGASSSGKTSLCKELQDVMDAPYIHLEEDRFVYGTYHGRYLQPGVVEHTFARTMLGYYRSLLAFASAGQGVLADTGVYSQDLLQTLVKELGTARVWLVGVRCSLEELERRERARADRQAGLAREQYQTIHAGLVYDVEVDTAESDLRECALRVKALVEGGGDPTAICTLRDRIGGASAGESRRPVA